MSPDNVRNILANCTIPASADDRLALARLVAHVDESLCRSFPIRRLAPDEAMAVRHRHGLIHRFKHEEWDSRWSEGKFGLVDRFLARVRRSVSDGALVFYLSPILSWAGDDIVLWLIGATVSRQEARVMGQSFNREMRTGRRSWWR